jgi:hypothetical protein
MGTFSTIPLLLPQPTGTENGAGFAHKLLLLPDPIRLPVTVAPYRLTLCSRRMLWVKSAEVSMFGPGLNPAAAADHELPSQDAIQSLQAVSQYFSKGVICAMVEDFS